MKIVLSKFLVVAVILLAPLPSLAMDSVAVERFQSQTQEPLNIGREGDGTSSPARATGVYGHSQHEGLKKVDMGNRDGLRRNVESRVNAIDK
ncbi:hypothetical protein ACRHM7_07265 [Chromohalobacter israelensis]|uniref:hypothetical protein n=1 Tax=Chromohalobacter israelensis TaxID=141390 RepID=UPI000D71D339|nr:hypothetical protein [Chromohalobacter salexigens]PWW33834.1 hypothetical protein DFO74_12330 [Chromohalobacter salexigens]